MSVGVCQPASCRSAIETAAQTAAHQRPIATATSTVRSACPLGNDESSAAMWNEPS
jgi:hypothetical protein